MITVHPITFATLTLTLGLAACRDAAPEPSGAPATSRTGAAVDPTRQPESPSSPAPTTATAPSVDPELADKLADLDAMCEALNRDYGDGTLGDYYAGLVPRTDWGKQQIAAGNASIQPGRLLERAIAELAPRTPIRPDGQPDPLGHCRKLLDYLDDVE
jgi:hypothetical protein